MPFDPALLEEVKTWFDPKLLEPVESPAESLTQKPSGLPEMSSLSPIVEPTATGTFKQLQQLKSSTPTTAIDQAGIPIQKSEDPVKAAEAFYMNPAVSFTKLVPDVEPSDSPAMASLKAVDKLVLGVPEFMTSPVGVAATTVGGAAGALGKVVGPAVQRAIAAGFGVDMFKTVADQLAPELGRNWDKMTPGQKWAGVIETLGTAGFAALLGHATAVGDPRSVKKQIPIS